MNPYISLSLAAEHISDARRQASAARLAARVNRTRRVPRRHRLVRSA